VYDFTRYARLLALLLPAYMFFVVLWVIVGAVAWYAAHSELPHTFLWWPLPVVFPVASLLLLAATIASLRGGRIEASQLTATIVSAMLLVIGALMAMSAHRPHDTIPFWISGGVFVALILMRLLRIGVSPTPASPPSVTGSATSQPREERR